MVGTESITGGERMTKDFVPSFTYLLFSLTIQQYTIIRVGRFHICAEISTKMAYSFGGFAAVSDFMLPSTSIRWAAICQPSCGRIHI